MERDPFFISSVPKLPVEKPTFDVVDGKLVQLEPQDIAYREAFRDGKLQEMTKHLPINLRLKPKLHDYR